MHAEPQTAPGGARGDGSALASGAPAPAGDAPVRVAFVTLGCAKNEVDSADMARRLAAAGFSCDADADDADVVVVNTCSFIEAATQESIAAVLDALEMPRVREGSASIVVAGCMPARYGDDLAESLPEVATFVPCSREDDIVEVVRGLFPGRKAPAGGGPRSPLPAGEGSGVSAYMKISDGCDRFCSYCAIPYIRGRYHSFTRDDVMADVRARVDEGAREIVLIAQDTGRWGRDFEEPSSLAALLDELAAAFPDTWFRVMYVQPEGVDDDLLSAIRSHENICSYLDVPFQHCAPRILRAMNRAGSGDEFLQLVRRIRREVPGVALRTTLIAGFPGETVEEHEELLAFVEEADLDYVGVFAYSQEEGTRAAELDGQLDAEEKAWRAQQVRDVADACSYERVAARVGDCMRVLVLGAEEDGQLYGRAACQAPDVDGVTYLDAGQPGTFVDVRITDTLLYEMEGACDERVEL